MQTQVTMYSVNWYYICNGYHMKKLILICLVFFLVSCEKETVPCNCGLILDDNVQNYSVLIRNDCSKNEKWWILSPGDWQHAHPGDNYCITNVDTW